MRFRGLAIAGFIAASVLSGAAIAQTAEPSQPQVFNGSSSPKPVQPIFIQGGNAAPPSAGMKTTTPYIAPDQRNTKADSDYEEMAKKIEEKNKKEDAGRTAAVRAQYDSAQAQYEATLEADRRQREAAAQQATGGAQTAQKAPAQAADPYAGKTVVFTNKKKADADKPVRLFNVK